MKGSLRFRQTALWFWHGRKQITSQLVRFPELLGNSGNLPIHLDDDTCNRGNEADFTKDI